jgi:hypothetical protein
MKTCSKKYFPDIYLAFTHTKKLRNNHLLRSGSDWIRIRNTVIQNKKYISAISLQYQYCRFRMGCYVTGSLCPLDALSEGLFCPWGRAFCSGMHHPGTLCLGTHCQGTAIQATQRITNEPYKQCQQFFR